jgi:uncharacterized Fe-S cluster protein YjdI
MLAFVSEPLNKFIWRERHSEKMRSICEHGSEQLQGNRKTFDFESAKHEKIDGLMLFASVICEHGSEQLHEKANL